MKPRIGIMYSGVPSCNGADYVAEYLANGFRACGINPVMIGYHGMGCPPPPLPPVELDLIVHSSGYNLTPEYVSAIQRTVPIAMWTHNDEMPNWVERIAPVSYDVARHYSYTKAHPYGPHVAYMPLACDTSVYRPERQDKRYDIALIGSQRRWRVAFCDLLESRFPRSFFGWSMTMSVRDINTVYAQTKVVIAPVQDCDEDQPGRAWGCPCRTFDVRGAGACQLEVRRGGLADVYPDACTVTPTMDGALAAGIWGDMIEALLHDDERRNAIANRDYIHTMACNTYKHRAIQIMEDFGLWQ